MTQAKNATKRDEHGGFREKDLLESLVALIVIDEDAEKRRIAKQILDAETKPGSTDPAGQLKLPGFDAYDYEPDRMIRDNAGRITEQDRADYSYKAAESERAGKHARESIEWSDRKRKESEMFALWVIEQQSAGRFKKLSFGDFVRETGLFESAQEAA